MVYVFEKIIESTESIEVLGTLVWDGAILGAFTLLFKGHCLGSSAILANARVPQRMAVSGASIGCLRTS